MVQKLLSPLFKMSRGGIAGLLAALAVAGVVAFFSVARWVNTSPSQCVSCHPQLTAMWERSEGHPGSRVGCFQCHAGHAEAPQSLNLGAMIRDQLVPEKYLSSDTRVERRCEGCHDTARNSGTGPEMIAAKEHLKSVANLLSGGALPGTEVVVPEAAVGASGELSGIELLRAATGQLRTAEWRAAFGAGGGTVQEVRGPLEFSAQSLRWARVREAKVRDGVVARVRSRLTLYKGGLGTVHRGLERLLELLPEGVDPAPAVVEEARSVLEGMSRGVKAAARSRTALIREVGGMDGTLFNPDGLAKALRVVPRALKRGQWDKAREAVVKGHEMVGEAGSGFDQQSIDTRAQERSENLTRVLEAKLAGLKAAVSAVLSDLPGDGDQQAAAPAKLAGAAVRATPAGAGDAPLAPPVDPRDVIADAATAVRSLEVSLDAAPNLGWADFSLRESQVKALADRFEALVAALEERERNAPEAVAVRRGLEQTLAALEAAGAADGLGLAYRTPVTGGGGPLRIPLVELAQRGVTALLDHQAGLETRRIIKVNHKVHFQLRRDPASGREVELGCLDCHRNIAHDKAQLETFRPRMASCFVGNCHRKDRNKDNCLRCHYQQLSELTARAN